MSAASTLVEQIKQQAANRLRELASRKAVGYMRAEVAKYVASRYAKPKASPGQGSVFGPGGKGEVSGKQQRWITLNADDDGGTKVKIDGQGRIQAGPDSLAGKHLSEIDKDVKGTEKDRRGENFNPETKKFASLPKAEEKPSPPSNPPSVAAVTEPASTKEPEKSAGHVAFIGDHEYFKSGDGQLYKAQISSVVMPDGFRSGRWEAPSHMADARVKMLQSADAKSNPPSVAADKLPADSGSSIHPSGETVAKTLPRVLVRGAPYVRQPDGKWVSDDGKFSASDDQMGRWRAKGAVTEPGAEEDAPPERKSSWIKNGDGTWTAPNGAVWKKAAAGGEVSDVTGEEFKGGRWMPIHGLSPKVEKKPPKTPGEASAVKPNEDAKAKAPRPAKQWTPEQIEEERIRRDAQSKWDTVRSGPLGELLPMGERPHGLKSTTGGTKRWQAMVESAGLTGAQVKDLGDYFESKAVQDVVNYVKENPHQLKTSEGRTLTPEDAVQGYKETAQFGIDNAKNYHTKKHLKTHPDSPRANHWLSEYLERRDAKGANQIDRMKEAHDAIDKLKRGESLMPKSEPPPAAPKPVKPAAKKPKPKADDDFSFGANATEAPSQTTEAADELDGNMRKQKLSRNNSAVIRYLKQRHPATWMRYAKQLSFLEDDHPRGQPDNAGQFVAKNKSARKTVKPTTDMSNTSALPVALTSYGDGQTLYRGVRANGASKSRDDIYEFWTPEESYAESYANDEVKEAVLQRDANILDFDEEFLTSSGDYSGELIDERIPGLADALGIDRETEIERDRLWDVAGDDLTKAANLLRLAGFDGWKWREGDGTNEAILLLKPLADSGQFVARGEAASDTIDSSGTPRPGKQMVSTKGLKVRMRDLRIAEANLADGKESVTPSDPVEVTYNVDTGEYELLDGYHRYLKARGGTIAAAKDSPHKEIPAIVTFVKNDGPMGTERELTDEESDEFVNEAPSPKPIKADAQFAANVQSLVDSLPESLPGSGKVLVSTLYDEASKNSTLSIGEFRDLLAQANADRKLTLSRADLVEGLDADELDRSEVQHPSGGGTFHFVRKSEEPAKYAQDGEPEKAAKSQPAPPDLMTQLAEALVRRNFGGYRDLVMRSGLRDDYKRQLLAVLESASANDAFGTLTT